VFWDNCLRGEDVNPTPNPQPAWPGYQL
jgi:hypothetical protein